LSRLNLPMGHDYLSVGGKRGAMEERSYSTHFRIRIRVCVKNDRLQTSQKGVAAHKPDEREEKT